VREIHRRTRRRFSAEEKVRIVLEGLRGADSGHRDHRDRGIVIARIGDRDRNEATQG
jgi:transposase-like protein